MILSLFIKLCKNIGEPGEQYGQLFIPLSPDAKRCSLANKIHKGVIFMAISTANYKSAIDGLNVATNSKYQPSTSGTTYCNVFANDVMNGYGYPLPANGSGNCAAIFDGLYGNVDAHWKSVSYTDAQARANSGYPTVGITSGRASKSPDTTMPEHIVVIYPSGHTPTSIADMDMSMAGYQCFNNTKLSYAWTSTDQAKVKFYSYN